MKLKRSFYTRNTIKVAKELLGCFLVHKTPEGLTKGRIVEVEAYMGLEDKGAHSYLGRHTPTMDPLYKIGGFGYVFVIHGHNYCLNVVTQNENMPEAVLIRAIEPVECIELMSKRRQIILPDSERKTLKNLTNGPSKLCQAFNIDTSLNGIDLCGNELFITTSMPSKDVEKIVSAPRINIDYAEEYQHKLWRFFLKNNIFISRSI
jgi:DNA-3-methyladenine glycosylase